MRFVTLFRFTSQGVASVKQTTKRAKDFIKVAKAAGVEVSDFVWTQGQYDGVFLFEAPDRETASATMLSLSSRGNVQTETMTAFDAKEMDKVLSKIR